MKTPYQFNINKRLSFYATAMPHRDKSLHIIKLLERGSGESLFTKRDDYSHTKGLSARFLKSS
jgi:hypothetical protein